MISILNIVPISGTLVLADTFVQFDVRTPVSDPFIRVFVAFEYTSYRVTELAYAQDPAGVDANLFNGLYSAVSTIEAVADPGYSRYRFRVLRSPLWPDSPKLIVYAFNSIGEEL